MSVLSLRGNGMKGLLLLLLASAAGEHVQAEDLRVENISFNATDEGLTVYVKTTGLLSGYRCDLKSSSAAAGGRSIVLELPGAITGLEDYSEIPGDLLRGADVESSLPDGHGVRIRFLLDKGSLSQVEQVGTGLLLLFEEGSDFNGAWRADEGEAYRVGVGDELEIAVFGHEDLHRMTEVKTDGTIDYPFLGDIQVAGQSVSRVKEMITAGLARDYLVDPQVNVEVREYRSQWVTVIGAVRSPSRYVLSRNMRLIDLLAAAGGLSAEAGSDILITRRDSSDGASGQISVARETLFSPDNISANVPLAPGDIVTVSERAFFYIRGEVNRPDAYIFKNGMTLLRAISIAGGFSQFANHKEVELLRMGKNEVHDKTIVNVKSIENGKQEDIILRPEDIIIVPRRIF